MKRLLCVMAVASAVVVGSWSPAAAQATGGWSVLAEPYLMGAAMSGDVTLRGRDANVEMSASDIMSNLQFGAMGMLVAKKGQWGVGADAIWMALGTTVRNTNVDMNQGAFAFYGLRQLGPSADLTFGLRVNTLQGALDFKTLGVAVSQDKTWVDPLVGLSLRTAAGHRMQLRLYSEIGGFGAGSTLAWQIFPTVAFHVSDRVSLDVGYRWLDLDYSKGEGSERFAYDVLTQGPVAGVGFKF